MSNELVDTLWMSYPYLHSPIDDLQSFYYTTQWAVAFNDGASGGRYNGNGIHRFRRMISGDGGDRLRATDKVQNALLPHSHTSKNEYGPFFAHSLARLTPWLTRLAALRRDWGLVVDEGAILKDEGREGKHLGLNFLIYGYRGVGEYFELLHEHRALLQEVV